MRILVFGTGALGTLLGGCLTRDARSHVTLAGSWRGALDAIRESGIEVEEPERTWSTSVDAADASGPLPPSDLVLVLVKSYQSSAVAAAVARAAASRALVLTLQNGLGNREALEAQVGVGRVAVGITTVGATLRGPGRVRAVPGRIELGVVPGGEDALEQTAALFRNAGIATEIRSDLDMIVWRKLAVNCAINPLGALRRTPNGELLRRSEDRALLRNAAREVGAVAAARGIDLGSDPVAEAERVALATAGNRNSMLQDLERGAPTEIEALSGAVVSEGARLGVPTPVNRHLRDAILREEQRGRVVVWHSA